MSLDLQAKDSFQFTAVDGCVITLNRVDGDVKVTVQGKKYFDGWSEGLDEASGVYSWRRGRHLMRRGQCDVPTESIGDLSLFLEMSEELGASSTSVGEDPVPLQHFRFPIIRRQYSSLHLTPEQSVLDAASESATPSLSSTGAVKPSGFASVIQVDDEPQLQDIAPQGKPSGFASVIQVVDEPQLQDIAPEGNPIVQMDSCCSPSSRCTMEFDSCSLDPIQSTPRSTAGESLSNCRFPSTSRCTIDNQSPSARISTGGSAVNAFRSPRGRITSPVSLKSSPASSKSTSEDIRLLSIGSGSPRHQFRFSARVSERKKRTTTTKSYLETGTCALIIKKRWLDLILAGQKTWEIRGTSCHKRGLIRLAQSKLGGMIVGEATVTDCLRVTLEDLQQHVDKHRIQDLSLVRYKTIFAWVLSAARRFRHCQPYDHKAGAITWVELDAHTIQQCNAASAECRIVDDDVIMESVGDSQPQ